jgi:hypothetical protein
MTSIHRISIVVILTISTALLETELAVAHEDMAGQHLCSVSHVAGIEHRQNQASFAGSLSMPETMTKFSITVRPIERDISLRHFCQKALAQYAEILESNKPFEDFDRGLVASRFVLPDTCLMKDELIMNRAGKEWKYRSYNLQYKFYGYTTSTWFELYADGSFRMGDEFDGGTVVVYDGTCVKLSSNPK